MTLTSLHQLQRLLSQTKVLQFKQQKIDVPFLSQSETGKVRVLPFRQLKADLN